jgi:hypothetical protein
VAAAVAVSVATGRAFNPQPEPPAFGMVGLTRSQSAILNAVITEAGGGARTGCDVVLSFLDAEGEPFQDAAGAEVSRRVTLLGGAAESLQLQGRHVLPAVQMRASIRARIEAAPEPAASDCGGLVATLEIVDGRGRTTLLYPGPAVAPALE